MKIMIAFGTRPEAIKMVPIIKELEKEKNFETIVLTTGQHKEMLEQVLNKFNILPKYNLNIMKRGQSISYINSTILEQTDQIIKKEKPNIILVHGDTTTSLSCAQAAFYNKVKIGHVEAGLRTYNKYSPFPEEMNRVLISKLADIHFAPTKQNYENLIKEGIKSKTIILTGNTVIDAMKYTIQENYQFENAQLKNKQFIKDKKYILITAHRRENLGKPLENICEAVNILTKTRDDIEFIYPVHPNPKVKETVESYLHTDKVLLLPPLNVFDIHNLMARCYMILTDSGGLQEEGPAVKKPVLVLRENTERPEAIEAGVAELVGVNTKNIVNKTNELLDNSEKYEKMINGINPYGIGNAANIIVDTLKSINMNKK